MLASRQKWQIFLRKDDLLKRMKLNVSMEKRKHGLRNHKKYKLENKIALYKKASNRQCWVLCSVSVFTLFLPEVTPENHSRKYSKK